MLNRSDADKNLLAYTCFSSKIIQSLSSLHYFVNIFLHDTNHFIYLLLHSGSFRSFLRLFAAITCGSIGNIGIIRLSPGDIYDYYALTNINECAYILLQVLNGKKEKPFLPSCSTRSKK